MMRFIVSIFCLVNFLLITMNLRGGDNKNEKQVQIKAVWILPDNLLEISGFCFTGEDRVACIQDEKGIIFIYNFSSCEIEKQISFGPDGDYEDIVFTNSKYYVLRSDGVIFCVDPVKSGLPVVKQYDIPLPVKKDVEGLCFDVAGKQFLIVIKSSDSDAVKQVYAISPDGMKLKKNPFCRINTETYIKKEASRNPKKVKDKGYEEFKKGEARNFLFSALAMNPLTSELYLTDGESSKLFVVNKNGEISGSYQIDRNYLPKPEGIGFTSAGELLISSEGDDKHPGVIAKIKINK